MIEAIGHHGSDEAHLVHVLRNVVEQLADRHSHLPVALECPWRLHQRADVVELGIEFERRRLEVIAIEHGLRIEGVDVRWPSIHEQEDDALGPWREMRRLVRGWK